MSRNSRPRWRAVDGILLLDKPTGITSNTALQQARRLYLAEKAGHTGSLDPLATGMLPVCFGQATKLGGLLLDADKRYRATVRLGIRTATGDVDGEVVATRELGPLPPDAIAAVIPQLLGEIEQVPPMYSAIKRAGQPLYALARKGIEVEREARRVTIRELKLIATSDTGFEFEVLCSKGTYVRTLAEDWAALLGQYGHLTALRRLETGPFREHDLVTPERLTAAGHDLVALDRLLLPLAAALPDWPRLHVEPADVARLRRGLECGPYPGVAPGRLLVLDEAGVALFLAEADAKRRVAPKRWIGPDAAMPPP